MLPRHNHNTYHHQIIIMLLQAMLCLNIAKAHILDGKEKKSLAVGFVNEVLFKKYDHNKDMYV